MKKYIFGAVLSIGLLVSPVFTQAAGLTTVQINAILSLLSSFGADSSVISNVNVALGGAPVSSGSGFCYNFNTDLTVGSGGSSVSALNQVLSSSGIDTTGNSSTFDENDAADVVSFQARYGIRQTGYVGPITRAKLNALYGCRNGQQVAQIAWPTAPTVIIPPYMTGGVTYTAPVVDNTQTSINVLYPTAGMTFVQGQPITISWRSVRSNSIYTLGYGSDETQKGLIGTYSALQAHCDSADRCYISWTPEFSSSGVIVGVSDYAVSGLWGNSVPFSITAPAPYITGTFSFQQQYGSGVEGQMISTYTYQIQNYRPGLVLDVQPIVNCNDTYITPLKRDCSQYWFTAYDTHTGVAPDPYVKAPGIWYRFEGLGDRIQLIGSINPSYIVPGGYITPSPDNIDFKFILRDMDQSKNPGVEKELWSDTQRAQFKG